MVALGCILLIRPVSADTPFTTDQVAAFRDGERVGRAFLTGASPKRCAIVIFRPACREDLAAARADGLLSAAAYRAAQPYLEGGDVSLLAPRLLDLDVGKLATLPGEAAFFRNLGTSKVIAQTTVGIAGVEAAAATMIREALRHAPRAFSIVPRDASQREFAADVDHTFPDAPASAVIIGEPGKFARLGLYLGSFEETLDEPMLVLDGSTRGFLSSFLDAYQSAVSSPEDLRALGDVRGRLTAARSVNDIPRLELARRNLRGIATHVVPAARVAEFDFGVAAAQGAYNAAVRKDPEAATRWMDFAGAYDGLDADPLIKHLRDRVKSAHSDDWREQSAAFTLLANAILQTAVSGH